ncbi:SURF1 family protein [Ramlibacter sp. H39-3-26]|uniref:SURF1 family protein n=1 Tax=Curvibacter soli TaxID=3031331 RepID=UPI0023DB62C1|nr:SURF1 family protein [Ramlibacter sp. H39-3-26]MDF1484826.1 SURF1 family protein [Ramlibacter sp. H39-3-26]
MTRAAQASGRFWRITLAAVACVAATMALGLWQLSRAAQREALQAAVETRAALPPLDAAALAAGAGDGVALLHRRVLLAGHWLADATVYLDNRQMHGRPGFYVVTPLALEPGPAVVAVQRGWIARDFEQRTRLAPVDTPAGVVQIEGRIDGAPARLLEFGAAAADEGFSRIRQNLDLAAYGAQIHVPLLTAVSVQQTGADSEGLQRDWPRADAGAARNYGYAFQWFGLAALIAALYVWFQLVQPYRRNRHG